MVSLVMVMFDELVDELAHMSLAKRNHAQATETLLFDRADEPLGIGVEIGTLRWQPNRLDTATRQDLAEDGTVKFSGSVADLVDETRHAELPRIPLSPEIISHAVWLYHRFGVSFRDVEDLLAQRGITVSYEAIRLWCLTFGSAYARRLKCRQGRRGDIWHLDEVFVTIQGRRHYLWRAVDQDGDVIDMLVQSRRDCRAATRFFRKLLKGQERQPGWLVTDKLSSYRAAHRAVMPSVAHRTNRYGNNRAEVSHQPTRQRERQMRCLCRSLLIRQPFVVRTATRTSAARLCQVLCAGRSRECARPPQSNVERDRAP